MDATFWVDTQFLMDPKYVLLNSNLSFDIIFVETQNIFVMDQISFRLGYLDPKYCLFGNLEEILSVALLSPACQMLCVSLYHFLSTILVFILGCLPALFLRPGLFP